MLGSKFGTRKMLGIAYYEEFGAVPDEVRKDLVPGKIPPTAKAVERMKELYSSLADEEEFKLFLDGKKEWFLLDHPNPKRAVRMDWQLFYGCMSYPEIWSLVKEEHPFQKKKVSEELTIEEEFDLL